jgi:nucleotide-binding universal stress UspA family protein
MLKRILLPLDGSEHGAAAVTRLRPLLLRKHAELLLLRVVAAPHGLEGDRARALEELGAEAVRYLEEVEGSLRSEGVPIRSLVRTGPAAGEILDVARKEGATLIAMATHGRSGLPRWILGSVAEKVLRASPVPVLALRSFGEGGGPPPAAEFRPKRILAAIDAADRSLAALEPAVELAEIFRAEVRLIHVCDDALSCSVPVPQLTRAYERCKEAGLAVEPLLRQGDPAGQILEAAQEVSADLVALATHGRSGPSRWLLGSVAERVLRSTSLPLLLVRSPA